MYGFSACRGRYYFTEIIADMTFQTVQVTSLLLFFIFLNSLTDNTAAITIRQKCECIRVTNVVQKRHITDFRVIMAGPFCNKVQIILQVRGKSVCLDPDSKLGTSLRNCWKQFNFNQRRKKDCLGKNERRRRPKKQ